MSAQHFLKIAGHVVCNSSEIVRHGSVKSAALPKLRRADSDAAAVAEFIDIIQEVHKIEPDFEQTDLRDLQISLQR